MKTKWILIFLFLLVFIGGCEDQYYPINNLNLENENIGFGQNTKLFFDITNNLETTLLAKVEVQINESCFEKIQEKELGEISPSKNVRDYVVIRSKMNSRNSLDSCNNQIFIVELLLKDINGKLLNSKTTIIGIVD